MELAHKKEVEDYCATNYINKAGTSGNKSKTVFQKGGSDCGLFAIAYAIDLFQGMEPAGVRYLVIVC